jgi:flavin reductase (DIM6/NTAB) family NADH-FMN oxidoreductase RutF
MPLDQHHFRRVCGKFASGITVVTVRDAENGVHGMTANSFTSVSLAPPLVLVCVDHRAHILEHVRISPHFGINILSACQRSLSDQFASRRYDRFEGVEWVPGETGVPLLADVLATLECARVNVITAGDHDILIGEVLHSTCREGEPLLFFGSQYHSLHVHGK